MHAIAQEYPISSNEYRPIIVQVLSKELSYSKDVVEERYLTLLSPFQW
jgi:hypothetical protein